MATIPPLAREAIDHARRGDFERALATARRALEQHSGDVGLQLFTGMLHAQQMDFDGALPHLRAAVDLAPGDAAARLELARALIAVDELDEAERVLSHPALRMRDAEALRTLVSSRKGNLQLGIEGFRRMVEQDPNDFESWANLGMVLLNAGEAAAAAEALGRALELRPDRPRVMDKWAEAHVAAGTAERALASIRAQMAQRGGDVLLASTAARLEDLLGRPDRALEELHAGLAVDPSSPAALIAAADLFERQNQLDAFAETIERLQKAAPHSDMLPLLRATLAFRRGQLEEALALARAVSPVADPSSRAHLIGRICDRLGRTDEAWDAYSAMNREDERAVARAAAEADESRAFIKRSLDKLTPEWAQRWVDADDSPVTPSFIVGFPRSGTTLIDTFLMAHPALCVSEENTMTQLVLDAVEDLDRLPELGADERARLRSIYFDEADRAVPGWRDRMLVDKLPFALIAGPHIHRLFPGAPIIFVQRHPCDVVLSCFFNRFVPKGPAANFVDLEKTARIYDEMLTLWTRSCELLPLRVHAVRYEDMIEDTEGELRKLADFLGVSWSDELLDNRRTASSRGFIKTPSYAQVSEAVYKRSVARWTRYRKQLEPALPILQPWIERFGYEV